MHATVFVNGRITDARDAVVSIFDHGFLYGEGVYETLRTYGRRPFLFGPHVHRLRQSAALMALDVPFTDDSLQADVDRTLAAHGGVAEAYIRILLTRGVGELSYSPAACPVPGVVIIVKDFPGQPERTFTEGIGVALVSVRRNHPETLNPRIKSNNLLNNALAMQEALRRGAEEALMQNLAGEVVECAQANVFVVRGGEVITPPVDAGLLPGITRECVLTLAREAGYACREARLTPDDVFAADEAFITGTTREVTPVVRVDDRPIGGGVPGPVTRTLLARLRALASVSASAG
ncbi:MAG: aminotransferase class IV [Vicinamibacterales bacterium]